MKQQVNPTIIIVVAVVLLGVLGFYGWRIINPPPTISHTPSKMDAPMPTFNGKQPPPGAPVYLFKEHSQGQQPGAAPGQ